MLDDIEDLKSAIDHQKNLIREYTKSLQSLELKGARFGIHIPPHMEIEIADTQELIKYCSERIAEYQQRLSPLQEKFFATLEQQRMSDLEHRLSQLEKQRMIDLDQKLTLLEKSRLSDLEQRLLELERQGIAELEHSLQEIKSQRISEINIELSQTEAKDQKSSVINRDSHNNTPDTVLEPLMAYCVSCRTKRPMMNTSIETTENGRKALRGSCSKCGVNMFRFVPD